ncbi:MAG: TonB-dependent receptor, partial [Aestuariibacter sp.]|nr:TonB-dependent receptor [Aestuariibacter sp.]
LLAGAIQADNAQGTLLLGKGQAAVAPAGQPPRLETVVRPRDAVQWALYYPPIFSYDPRAFKDPAPDSWQARANQAAQAIARKDLTQALDRLEDLPDPVDDPQFYVYRASLKLTVGSVADADADIAKALALDENNSPALALRAVMAVVQNRKADALNDARQAVESDPLSAVAQMALSYAHQADFNLAAAHQAAQAAVEAQPDNALAWARLAELRLALG